MEKAREVRVKADEEFAIEKVCLPFALAGLFLLHGDRQSL